MSLTSEVTSAGAWSNLLLQGAASTRHSADGCGCGKLPSARTTNAKNVLGSAVILALPVHGMLAAARNSHVVCKTVGDND
eukprot:6460802-Amphidinium_carterae.1